jgi:hypothetical protein
MEDAARTEPLSVLGRKRNPFDLKPQEGVILGGGGQEIWPWLVHLLRHEVREAAVLA